MSNFLPLLLLLAVFGLAIFVNRINAPRFKLAFTSLVFLFGVYGVFFIDSSNRYYLVLLIGTLLVIAKDLWDMRKRTAN